MELFYAVTPPAESDKTNYTFVTGQRGAQKILYDGFTYICAKIFNDRRYWVCAKQRSRNCKARLIITKLGSLEVSRNVFHNHGPEVEASRARKPFKLQILHNSDCFK